MAEHGALATLKDLAEKEVEDAARLLTERYDVTPQRARLDAEAWIRRLETCGIVER